MIRLYIEIDSITLNSNLELDKDKTHYLKNVMKRNIGDDILLFNAISGEFLCEIIELSKKKTLVAVKKQTRPQFNCKALELYFAPVKKTPTDIIIEKTTELGVTDIYPVFTDNTIVNRVNTNRLTSIAIEASEQSRRLDIPTIHKEDKLKSTLQNWDNSKILYYLDETGAGKSAVEILKETNKTPCFLIGPEGGFSKSELEYLAKQEFTRAISLGSRILRAETACISALSIYQSILGDWS